MGLAEKEQGHIDAGAIIEVELILSPFCSAIAVRDHFSSFEIFATMSPSCD